MTGTGHVPEHVPEHVHEHGTAALLRAALLDDLEAVMSATDTERELLIFESGVERRGRRTQFVAAAAAGLVGVAAVGAFLAVRSAGDGPTAAAGGSGVVTGRMSLVQQRDGRLVDGRSDQAEWRGMEWTGDLVLDVGRPLAGTVRVVLDGSGVGSHDGLTVLHAFGTAAAELDGQRCAGTVGLSFYAGGLNPAETGGAMQLSCEDGSVLGLGLAVVDYASSRRVKLSITVDDGFHRAG